MSHNFLIVGIVKGMSKVTNKLRAGHRGLRLARQVLVEPSALDQLHYEIRAALVCANLFDLHDVLMPHPGCGFGFDPKACQLLLASQGAIANHLQGNHPAAAHVPGSINNSHPAAANFVQDVVTWQGRKWSGGPCRRAGPVPCI